MRKPSQWWTSIEQRLSPILTLSFGWDAHSLSILHNRNFSWIIYERKRRRRRDCVYPWNMNFIKLDRNGWNYDWCCFSLCCTAAYSLSSIVFSEFCWLIVPPLWVCTENSLCCDEQTPKKFFFDSFQQLFIVNPYLMKYVLFIWMLLKIHKIFSVSCYSIMWCEKLYPCFSLIIIVWPNNVLTSTDQSREMKFSLAQRNFSYFLIRMRARSCT